MLLISSLPEERDRQNHAGSPLCRIMLVAHSQIQEIVRVLDVTMCDFVTLFYRTGISFVCVKC